MGGYIMVNIYYTANTSKRGINGHTITRGNVYRIRRRDDTTPSGTGALIQLGQYRHQSGGAELESSLLSVLVDTGVLHRRDAFGGRSYREFVNFIRIV